MGGSQPSKRRSGPCAATPHFRGSWLASQLRSLPAVPAFRERPSRMAPIASASARPTEAGAPARHRLFPEARRRRTPSASSLDQTSSRSTWSDGAGLTPPIRCQLKWMAGGAGHHSELVHAPVPGAGCAHLVAQLEGTDPSDDRERTAWRTGLRRHRRRGLARRHKLPLAEGRPSRVTRSRDTVQADRRPGPDGPLAHLQSLGSVQHSWSFVSSGWPKVRLG